MSYEWRDAQGILRGKISNSAAHAVMDSVRGKFVEKTFTKSGTVLCFVFSEDSSMDISRGNSAFSLFFWKDEYLKPC